MPSPNDFVYEQIYKGALSAGSSERHALAHAVISLEKYKKGRIGRKVSNLIEDHIAMAKKATKNESGKLNAKRTS